MYAILLLLLPEKIRLLRALNGVKISRCIINGDFIIDECGYIYTDRICEYKNLFFIRESNAIGRMSIGRWIAISKGCIYEQKMIELCDKSVFRFFEVGTDLTLPPEFYQSIFNLNVNGNEYFWHNYSKIKKGKEYLINEEGKLELLH